MSAFDVIQSAAAIVLTFGLVIFLHEAGHFILCRILGVRVERFAFGFGPELLGITRGPTRFSICAFPLGGFVKPAGEEMENYTGQPDEYFSQAWHRRLAIVAAGPVMNYLLAFALFTTVVLVKGVPEPSPEPIIGNLVLKFPADRAGLQVGDRVLAINGKAVSTWEEMAKTIHAFPDKRVELLLEREGRRSRVSLIPQTEPETGRGVIGITPKPVYRPVGLLESISEGARQCYALTATTVKTLGTMIVRKQKPDLAGPIGISQMISRASRSAWEDFVFLIGFLSVAIGFFNILPIPLLDGGHAMMYVLEGILRRKPPKPVMMVANSLGLAFLVSLLVVATFNDFQRMFFQDRGQTEQSAPPTP
ncbi:MAG: site-2 protease family protein [Elusimicrobia bacterium]|nr:site-2 protease family protein [Elusimicrobiota bacterium]